MARVYLCGNYVTQPFAWVHHVLGYYGATVCWMASHTGVASLNKALTLITHRSDTYFILKSLSPLFFSIFDEKLSHPWIQILKKTIELFTSFHRFWSQKDKNLSFDRADRGLVPMTWYLTNRDSIRKAREAFLIQKGRTINPDGLNIREETC